MATLIDKPRSDLTEYEIAELEKYEFSAGPLSILVYLTPVALTFANGFEANGCAHP